MAHLLRPLIATVLGAGVLVAPVSASAASGGVPAPGAAVTATTEAPIPVLAWQPCDGVPGVECATATVPLDHDQPDGETTSLALARVPAADAANRVGSVFVNPGGPGGSGVGFVQGGFGARLGDSLEGRFDVVGFDPRGVGASEPVRCYDTEDELFAFLGSQPIFPYTIRQTRPYYDANQGYAQSCLDQQDRVREHMSTADVVRDLDLLRQAVGDEQLTYLGFSYGSYIGNTYANLFPDKVRALVIDGVLDPQAWADGTHIKYDQTSAQAVLEEFFRLCDEAGPESCGLAPDAEARYEALAESLRDEPLDLGDFVYSYDFLIADSVGAMYSTGAWPGLAELLVALEQAVAGQADASTLRASRAALHASLGVDAAGAVQEEYDNGFDAYFGNYCSDAEFFPGFGRWLRGGLQAEKASRSGPYWWWFNAPCATLPAAEDRYTGPWDAKTSEPVLVVGNYFDPATDYQGAVVSADNLPNSRLLSYAGWGHTAYGITECTTSTIDTYVLTGELPPEGTVCEAEPNPFLASTFRSVDRQGPVVDPPSWLLRP